MGLTGIVLRATIRMQRCETGYFTVDTDRTQNLADTMELMHRDDDNYTYTVSWMDAVTSGRHMGRAVYTRGEKALISELPRKLRSDPLKFVGPNFGTIPDVFPNGMVNKLTAAAFSELWYRKAPKHRVGEVQNITQFFQPLDVFNDWNRGYGPAGFLQYQFQIPFSAERDFERTVEMITGSGHVSCLNVLKRFGEGNRGLLSFPAPAGPSPSTCRSVMAWTVWCMRWTRSCWEQAGASTWPRIPGSTPRRSPRCIRSWTSSGRSANASIPRGSSSPTRPVDSGSEPYRHNPKEFHDRRRRQPENLLLLGVPPTSPWRSPAGTPRPRSRR